MTIRATNTTTQRIYRQAQNLIGSPHPVSNIRPVKFTKSTPYTRALQEADEFNHGFWLENNHHFLIEKETFEKNYKIMYPNASEIQLQDALGAFYKRHLDEARERHLEYNRFWLKKNLKITIAGFQEWFTFKKVVEMEKSTGYFNRNHDMQREKNKT